MFNVPPRIRREFEYPTVARVSWVNGADEIWQQLKDQGISAQYLVTTISQGGTYAGLTVGTKYLDNPFKLIDITDHYTREEATNKIVKMANATAEFLELGITIAPEESLFIPAAFLTSLSIARHLPGKF